MYRLSILLCICLMLCGCGSADTSRSSDESVEIIEDLSEIGNSFSSLLKYLGYTVTQDMPAANSDEYINNIEIAVKDNEYQFEMYYISDSSKATKYYADFCRIYDSKSKTAKSISNESQDSSSYRMEDNGIVYRIIRYADKILVVSANTKYEENITKIIERLGEIYGTEIAG